ncbi:Gldg family protein [Pedobacter hiemivivus]|uniref:ABC transporter n=1 Tax=Pedobacter hiemivivus TaxID=2530454 RepID=A0A4R0NEQ6_9SPHI|nr:Gldg family protein [Pedobacter hiemivivus]TCC98835.1 ABC transporter [Pedobacter hiemivivus]
MNMILNIAKNELRKLFYSPVAWLVLIIFCIQCSMVFTNLFDGFLFWKRGNIETDYYTFKSFGASGGLYANAQSYIYLYIPLITMGIMTSEFITGSVKLLYSSPVTNTQIVIGKYLALLFFNLSLLAVLSVFSIYCLFSIEHVEIPLVLCGLFGLFLLVATYQAIGLFMSSISSHIVVAALGTFGILSILSFVGGLWQDVAYLRDITYWLSINSRAGTFIRGMITSEDLIYFIIISGMFLFLTISYLKFKRQPSTFIKRLSVYGGAVLVTMLIGYLSSMPDLKGYSDVTRDKLNTLTKNSQEIVSNLPKDITITTYVNVLARNSVFLAPDRFKNEQGRYEQFIRFKPRLKLEYVYYYHKVQNENPVYERTSKKSEKEMLDSVMSLFRWKFDVVPYADIKPKVDLASEDFQQVSLIQGSNNKSSWLRFFDDALVVPFESEISAAFKRLNQKLPVVGMVIGHDERSISGKYNSDYEQFTTAKRYRSSLINQGFDLREVSLDKPIDTDISILLLADPKSALTVPQKQNIQQYIASGRNMMILGEPGRQEYLNPVINDFGLQLLPGKLLDTTQKSEPDLMALKPSERAVQFSPYFRDISLRKQVLVMPSAAGIAISGHSGYQTQVLFESGTSSWNEGEKISKPYPTVVALSKQVNGKTQKIIVTGDADFLSTAVLNQNYQNNSPGNYGFISAAFSWLSNGTSPVDVHRPEGIDNRIKIDDKFWDISSLVMRWVYPLILIVIALIIYIRRRSR